MDMFKRLLPLVATTLLFYCTVGLCKQNLTIINNSSSDISAIYLSDSRTNDWEDNLMPAGYVLPSGNSIDITLEPKYSKFDLRVESTDGGAEDYMEYPGNTKLIQINGDGETEYE